MLKRFVLCLALLCALASPCLAATRALLVACSDFTTLPDLGSEISGNLHMLGSALLGAGTPLEALSIEDGTIGSAQALSSAITDTLGDAAEDDLSILYLCTHGVLSDEEGENAYLLLSDGENETPLDAQMLYDMLAGISGERLLILDACHSGAFISHGTRADAPIYSPFFADSGVSVLTSADGGEAGWYYDSERLDTGAVSYFASALSTGLGLYGIPEADADGSGTVTLSELYRYLRVAQPSSTAQLHSSRAGGILLPTAQGAMLSRPLTGFSYGSSLISASEPVFDFSFTVTRATAVQYRLIEYGPSGWDWNGAIDFADDDGVLSPGRSQRALTLPDITETDSGYLMLQIFSVSDNELILCSERLLAIQSTAADAGLSVHAPDFPNPGDTELPIRVQLSFPAPLTLTIYGENGMPVRRLCASDVTMPSPDDASVYYWDGLDKDGVPVPPGRYAAAAETKLGAKRVKSSCDFTIGQTPGGDFQP